METTETQTEAKIILSEREELREQYLGWATKQLEGLLRPYLTFKEYFDIQLPLEEIWEQATNPERAELFVRMLMYERNPELKKLPIPKQKALEFIELPQGYYAYLQNFIQRVKQRFEQEIDL